MSHDPFATPLEEEIEEAPPEPLYFDGDGNAAPLSDVFARDDLEGGESDE